MIRNRISGISRCLCVVLIATHSLLKPSIVLNGDSAAPNGATFSFPIKTYVDTKSGSHMYVGALNAGTGKEYSLSTIGSAETHFRPVAFEKVLLNGKAGEQNPLFDAGIGLLGLISVREGAGFSTADHPVVVTTAKPAALYLVQSFLKQEASAVLSIDEVKDANGATTSGIIAVEGVTGVPSGAFAAVKPNVGTFGATGSGIALANFSQAPSDEKEKTKRFVFFQNDLKNGDRNPPMASPLDLASPAVVITSNLSSMTDVVDIHWNEELERLYVTVQAQAGPGATDGARALVVGRIEQVVIEKAPEVKKGETPKQDVKAPRLVFAPIAPDSVFGVAQNEIVGGIGSNAQVSLHKVLTMKTSTGLDYLIILGGNGAPSATRQSLYALPIVNVKDATRTITNPLIHGVLANKNVAPVDVYSTSRRLLLRRSIPTPAVLPADIYTSSVTPANLPALIGGGPLAAGPIDDYIVSGDTVFAVVSSPAANQLPGIFSSQALFSGDTAITAWTPWQRVGGSTAPVFGASYHAVLGNFVSLLGANASAINTATRTLWGRGSDDGLAPLGSFFKATFPKDQGGIEGFYRFADNTPGLHSISMLIATGLNTVALAQTSRVVAGTVTPLQGADFAPQQTFTEGTLTANAAAPLIVISGGALKAIGPVVAAEIAVNGTAGTQGFIFVGGVNGLAVLSDASGNGWDTATSLGDNFSGLVNGMSFKLVGSYTFIRKLMYDGDFLYVLTDKKVDRLDLTVPGFPATTVATLLSPSIQENGTFLDLIVSGPCAFLGTSRGLFRVGNGANIQTASQPDDLDWTYVPLAEGCCPITQLFALSTTGRAQDVAVGAGGNLYVLNSYQGLDRGQVNRFSVQGVTSGINQDTLLPIPDMVFRNVPTSYANFGAYANLFVTDGALQLHALPRNLARDPVLKSGHLVRSFVTIPLDFSHTSRMVALVRNSATGSWLVAADSGLHINE